MASEHRNESTGPDPIEALIDDLIRDILHETGQPAKGRSRGMDTMASLIEKAIASGPSAVPTTSVIEKLLLSQVLASALADALAPALAEALAPEIMKAMEHYAPSGQLGDELTSAAGSDKGVQRKP